MYMDSLEPLVACLRPDAGRGVRSRRGYDITLWLPFLTRTMGFLYPGDF
jgi:hypothetical protein